MMSKKVLFGLLFFIVTMTIEVKISKFMLKNDCSGQNLCLTVGKIVQNVIQIYIKLKLRLYPEELYILRINLENLEIE